MSQKIPFTETAFRGLDATADPLALPPGVLQQLRDGMIVSGGLPGEGGQIRTRPGKRALLTSALPGPITAMKRYRQANGTRSLLLAVASSSVSTTGSIYRYDRGATSCTQLTSLGTFNVYDTQFAVLPAVDRDWCYLIGNVDGNLRRTDLSTYEVATGLTTPATAPTVALTNLPIDSTAQNAPANWAADTLVSTLADVVNGSFTGGALTSWTTTGVIEAAQPNGSPWYVRLDDAGSTITSTAAIVINAKANTYDTATPTRYANHFRFTGTFFTDSGGIRDGVTITVVVYSDTGATTEIARLTQEFTPGIVGTDVQLSHVFAFDFVDDSLPRSYKVTVGPGRTNRPGGNGPYLTAIHVQPFTPTVSFSQDGSQVAVAFAALASPSVPDDLNLYWGGLRLAHDLGSAKDLSTYQTIALPVTLPADVVGLRARLNLKTAANATPVQTNPLTLALDSGGAKYFYVDISTIAAASRNAVRYIELVFLADAQVVAGQSNGGTPIEIGVLSNSGGLTVGDAYYWRFTESEAVSASMIESGGSPLSVVVTTDGLRATATLILPALTNGAADHYALWRAGGALEPGFFYLENRVSATADSSGTGWTWNHTTRTYTTAIPDSSLLYADLFQDHNAPPDDADSIAVYQGRLVLGVGRKLYIARLELGIAAGLYWNDVPNPNAPDYTVQGNSVVVGGSDGGNAAGPKIVRIVSYQSRAVLFLENGIRILSGFNNTDFEVKEYQQSKNVGLLAAGAAAVAGEAGLAFLASDGLHAFDLADDSPALGRPIAKLLNPAAEFAGDALSAAVYARCSLIWHAGRLLLSAPIDSSATAIGTTYVFDARAGGGYPYEWRLGAILCGESFSGTGDQDDLIVGAADGMLYSLGNRYGDTSTSVGSAAAVTLSTLSRAFWIPESEIRALSLGFTIACDDSSAVVTWSVAADGASGKTHSGTYTIAAGETTLYPALLLGSQVRGRSVTVSLSIASTNPATIKRLALLAAVNRPI
jgi:hypothetical protein